MSEQADMISEVFDFSLETLHDCSLSYLSLNFLCNLGILAFTTSTHQSQHSMKATDLAFLATMAPGAILIELKPIPDQCPHHGKHKRQR